mgnify:CR=1 FL=1
MRSIGKSASHRWEVVLMKHKNMKQYEEKNDPMLNHDITLEEIEAACRAHQKEMITATWQRSAALLQENKKKNAGTVYKRKGRKASYPASPWPLSMAV